MRMDGKTVLVTGAGSGLGEAAARLLAERGARLVLIGRTADELQAVASDIAANGGDARAIVAEIQDEQAMAAAFRETEEHFGRLDGVFANAGINGTWAPLAELTLEEWQRTMRINLDGTFLTLRGAIPLMQAGGGSILITSSINGTRTFTTAGASAYSTTKAGQVALAQMAALELAQYRIRVNAICPGAIETEISDNTEKRNTDAARVPAEYPGGRVPLTGGKPGRSSDVAELVCFLLSDGAAHITGTPVWIDGGQSLLV